MKVLHRSGLLVTALCCAAVAVGAAPAGALADASGTDIVGWLNAQRTASGIPAVTEDAASSAGCLDYAQYLTRNPASAGLYPPGLPPGIGPAGAGVVAQSIIYWTGVGTYLPNPGPWTATQNPFEEAGFRLPYLLAPRLARLGAAESGDYGCVTARGDEDRAAPGADITYTYPGDGVGGWPTSQAMGPADRPGTQAPTMGPTTGPHLYVLFDGPDFDPLAPARAHVTAATLTGPDGAAVPVDTWDETTADVPATLPSGVQVIPVGALRPSATYTASVTALVTPVAGGAARTFTKTWSFTTAAERANHAWLYGAYSDPQAGVARASYYSEAPDVRITASGPGPTVTGTPTAPDPGSSASFQQLAIDRRGTWQICMSSGGPGTGYHAFSSCKSVPLDPHPPVYGLPQPPARPVVTPPAPRPAATKLKVSLPKNAKARWSGRLLKVAGIRCSAACTLRVTGSIRAGGKTYRIGTVSTSRRTAGTVTIKYTMSKWLAAKVRRAHARRVALTIVPKGGRAVRAALAVTAGK